MIRDKHNPAPKYKLLADDEMILQKDEYYDYVEDKWIEVESRYVGELYRGPYEYDHFLIVRRKK